MRAAMPTPACHVHTSLGVTWLLLLPPHTHFLWNCCAMCMKGASTSVPVA